MPESIPRLPSLEDIRSFMTGDDIAGDDDDAPGPGVLSGIVDVALHAQRSDAAADLQESSHA